MVGVELRPVGWVSSPRAEPIDDDWDSITATIHLDGDRFTPDALRGLDAFSHLEVVYFFDRVDPESVQTVTRRPRGNPDWPEVGIFAQRAKARPNRIGVSVCRLVTVEGLTVTVQALDAIDGSPILDIKPYLAESGPRSDVRQPAWSHQLMAGYRSAPRPSETAGPVDAVRRSYDAVAGRYATEIRDELSGKPLDRALLDALCELCADGTIADLGAGPGHVAGYLAGRGSQTLALDLSPVMCSYARADHGVPAAAGDMTALPLASASLAGVICFYALIHLDPGQRATAYREIARVLRPGGQALVAFHTSDADTPSGGAKELTQWWGHPVELTFRFLDPAEEQQAATAAGLDLAARLDRQPHHAQEHPSRRTYLLLRNTTE